MGAKVLYIDKGDAIPIIIQSGIDGIVAKPAPTTFGMISQLCADNKIPCGIFYEVDMFWYADQGFDPGNFTKWPLPDKDAQIQYLDRFINGHTVQFCMLDFSVINRNGQYLDPPWIGSVGRHFMDMVRKRYSKLIKTTYLYQNLDPVTHYPGNQEIVRLLSEEKASLAFPDFETGILSGKRPKLPYDAGNWEWWMYSKSPKMFTYAHDVDSLRRDMGLTSFITPPIIPPTTNPGTIPSGVDMATINSKLDAILVATSRINSKFT
jgi:hypothetical protein